MCTSVVSDVTAKGAISNVIAKNVLSAVTPCVDKTTKRIIISVEGNKIISIEGNKIISLQV